MIASRRRCLAGLCLAPLLFALPPTAVAAGIVARRWQSGNTRLAPPTLIDGRVLFAGERTLGLLDPAADRPLWTAPLEPAQGAVFRPRAADGMIVCGGPAELAGWRLETGEARWRHRARQQLGVPCLHQRRAYFGDGDELVALDLATGEALWRHPVVADTRISYAPAAAGGTILVGPGDGRLYALDADTGRRRWVVNRMADWQYLRQLHVSGSILVAGGYKEKLYGIDIASGAPLWEFNAGNFINSHHVAGGVAYLWSPTGWLYAVDVRSGLPLWRHRTTDYGDHGSHGRNWASLLAELASSADALYALDLADVLHVLALGNGKEVARLALPEPVRPFVLPLGGNDVLLGSAQGDLLLVKVDTALRP